MIQDSLGKSIISLDTTFFRNLISRIRRSGFARNFSVVFSGAVIAQLIAFGLAPVLSRIYDPTLYGIFGVFASIGAMTGSIASLRYEQAIMLTENERNVWPLQQLCIAITFSTALLTALGVAIALLVVPDYFLGIHAAVWVVGTGLFVLGNGLIAIFQIHASRKKKFNRVSLATILRTLFASGAQCLLGFWSATGLVCGALVGLAAGLIPYASLARNDEKTDESNPVPAKSLRELATKFIDFPKYNAPQGLMNSLNQSSPIFVLASFSPVSAGAYLMTVRLMQRPMGMITTPLRQVFFQHASELHRSSPQLLTSLYRKITLGLATLAILPAVVIFIGGPLLFEFVLGPEWTEAGEFARWVILWMCLGFMNVPAVMTARILRLEKSMMYYNMVLLVFRILALLLGCWLANPVTGVAAFCLVGIVFNLFLILWIDRETQRLGIPSGIGT